MRIILVLLALVCGLAGQPANAQAVVNTGTQANDGNGDTLLMAISKIHAKIGVLDALITNHGTGIATLNIALAGRSPAAWTPVGGSGPRSIVDTLQGRRSVREFGAQGYPANDTTALQAASTWVTAAPGRALDIPYGTWMVDALDINGCNRCKVDGSAATLLWSGLSKTFSDGGTGITYPQTLVLVRGDASINQGGQIEFGRLDGWTGTSTIASLQSDGIFVSAAYGHRIHLGSIWYTRYAINYSPHMNYASDTEVSFGIIKHTRRGIYQAPDYLYRDAVPAKPSFFYFSHLTENTRFTGGIIVDCIEYGIKRDAPTVAGSAQTGSNAINTFHVGAIDCTDYYDRESVTGNPIGGATETYYKGRSPIANPPSGGPTYPGKTRPSGTLAKSPSAAGAIDIRDDYEALGAPTPVTSRSDYSLTFLGNSWQWLLTPQGHGGAGLDRSNLSIQNQDFTQRGGIRIDGLNMTVTTNNGRSALFTSGPTTLGANTGTTPNYGAYNGSTATLAQTNARLAAIEAILRAQGLAQ